MSDAGRDLTKALLADQRSRWQAGQPSSIEAYLTQHPSLEHHTDGVLDLIYQEVFLREQRGEAAHLEEYLQRFPQYATELRLQFEVHQAIQPGAAAEPTGMPQYANLPGYTLEQELGRGAMGIVYRAHDLTHNRAVAVKMLLPEHFDNRSVLKRFLAEARAVTRLTHAHIVAVHEVGESPAGPYLVMELVDGPSLEALLQSGPIPIATAVDTLVPVAEAVDYAHRCGVIHRDLKPSNILLDPKRGPVVLDFGMAKVQRDRGGSSISTWTQPGTILGTPAFMPPEQTGMEGAVIGPSSDVYSLGAILYTMLVGRPPFAESNAMKTIRKVRAAPPPPISATRPEVPEALERVCLKCLAKDAAQRYPSAWTLAEALRAIQPGKVDEKAGAGIVMIHETTGRRHVLTTGSTVIGRAIECDISVADPKVSRRHCRIVVGAVGVGVEDLGSSWGTRVNDRRVERAPLSDGDRLEVGGHTFTLREAGLRRGHDA
jgi:tRNA A-37 threonylcarbamoyl transferase component Bud32